MDIRRYEMFWILEFTEYVKLMYLMDCPVYLIDLGMSYMLQLTGSARHSHHMSCLKSLNAYQLAALRSSPAPLSELRESSKEVAGNLLSIFTS